MFLEDLYKEFLFDLQSKNLSPRTIETYKNGNRRFLDHLQQTFDITQLEQVKATHIKSYLLSCKQKGNKDKYVNNLFKNIRALFRFCVEEDYLDQLESPVNKVKWMKEEKTIIKTFNDDEIRRMVNVYQTKTFIEARNKAILLTFIDSGIRNFENCSLMDADVGESTILIRGKGSKERYVSISPYLKKVLIKYERLKKGYFQDRILEHGNYFLSRNGKMLTVEANERIVRIAAQKAKVRDSVKATPHNLRHYYSGKMLKTGLDIYSLSRLLGHSSIDITKIYLQSIEDEEIVDNARNISPLMSLNKK